MLGINSWEEPKEMIKVFKSQHDVSFPLLQNGEETALDYGVGTGVPVTIWIQPDGTIQDVEMRFHEPEPLFEKTMNLLQSKG